ncbi:aminotransferase class I/II-fold pyridoxal phosphate-dependent enzyme [Embleya scabrispora]|uniref:aminotransferase class I/II-fold pyridoxal phosphate-dependent enzyme n=1 Tax=Embleya scabrispora TaxID=159449 RepID=UPI00037D651D|nr:aminotransferase class I/II-fold pyridoxal phosphate-dependent enzyme [Embleya scabrispora]MYS83891.1 aminotransferase class V-fold PLP-dependent enzyme [Streptomyces sp. SID5474]
MDTRRRLTEAFDTWSAWADARAADGDRFEPHLADLAARLRGGRPSPPRAGAGHPVEPPYRAALVGRFAATLVELEGRVCDGDPGTAALADEVVAELAAMFGLPAAYGRLTSGGAMANLEALRVAREAHPERGIAHSADGYAAHERGCDVLRVPAHCVRTDAAGRIDLDALATLLAKERVGTVVVGAGTDTLGAVDPIADILALCRNHDVRVHVDATHGGFFTLLAGAVELRGTPAARHLRAIAGCDSVAVDPHRRGLHPHACGALLTRGTNGSEEAGPGQGRRPGETGLDQAPPGATAAALWLTLRALPLTPDGLGELLADRLRSTRRWRDLIDGEPELMLYQEPELDILTYLPLTGEPRPRLSSVATASRHIVKADPPDAEPPVHLSTLRVRVLDFLIRHPRAVADRNDTHILRSTLLGPECVAHVRPAHERLTALAAAAPRRVHTAEPDARSASVESVM